MHKHVFLVGLTDPVMFKEMLNTNLLKIELHDCDEYVYFKLFSNSLGS